MPHPTAWSMGDYARTGARLVLAAELLCEAADVRGGARVLDVACGTGNVAIAAARRDARATGLDLTPSLLAVARERARVEGYAIDFVDGDACALPFADGAFDAVLSAFGVAFAPDHPRAAAELRRVCRPGGTIALAHWAPTGFTASFLAAIAPFVPPAQGPLPYAWGDPDALPALLGPGVEIVRMKPRTFVRRARSIEGWLDEMRSTFGPFIRLFEACAPERRDELAAALREVAAAHDLARDGTLSLAQDYLEVVARRVDR